ncbi:MAG: fatty acid--CoA ligase family protein [Chloroflexi bacterium]|nr:fatty acid--CoA ligase family protein [Chloroflexota bacterium]
MASYNRPVGGQNSIDDWADVLFTTGSTGEPKGVVLTQRNIAASTRNINRVIPLDPYDREVVTLPLHHSFGLGRVRCCLSAGASIVLTNGYRSPGQVIQTIKTTNATGFATVPAGIAILLRLFGDNLEHLMSSLSYVEIGSSAMPQDHKRDLMRLLPNTRLYMHYGLTEASRSAILDLHENPTHLESVGQPAPNVELAILDDQEAPLTAGQTGRIAVRGEHVSSEYLDSLYSAGTGGSAEWFITGDIGYLDASNFLYLVGREDDLINVGGEKVAPEEVEWELLKLPGIADAACVAIADKNGVTGQTVRAYVVADGPDRPSGLEIKSSLARSLQLFKVPTSIIWIDAIPRTASGKVQLGDLRHEGINRSVLQDQKGND